MSGNKQKAKKSSSSSHSIESNRRPNTLGFVILLAGGVSTWYWYKPLPPEAGQAAYSGWNHSSDSQLWGDTEIIRPTLDSLDNAPESDSKSSVDGLVGNGSGKLIPVPIYRKNAGELLAQEGLPQLPSIADIDVSTASQVNPWTNDAAPASLKPQVASNDEPGEWPDLSYQVKSNPAAKVDRMPSTPSLLPASTSSPPRLIRTQEQDFDSSLNMPKQLEQPPIEAPRTPQIIRQPKRSQ